MDLIFFWALLHRTFSISRICSIRRSFCERTHFREGTKFFVNQKKTNDQQTTWIVQRNVKTIVFQNKRSKKQKTNDFAIKFFFTERTNFPKDFTKTVFFHWPNDFLVQTYKKKTILFFLNELFFSNKLLKRFSKVYTDPK